MCRAHSCRCRHLFADMIRVRRTRHVNSRHRQRSRCQHHLASQGTAQTCTVVQCDYSHQIRLPLLFSKLPQQSRCLRIGIAIAVCLPVCLRFGAPSHVKIAKYNCVPFLRIRHRTLICFWYDFSTRARWRCSVTYISATWLTLGLI